MVQWHSFSILWRLAENATSCLQNPSPAASSGRAGCLEEHARTDFRLASTEGTIARPGLARKKQQSLADALPDEAEARRLREFEGIDPKEEVHCVLPADYNFFVDFVSVFHLVYYSISQEELGSWSTRQLMRRAAKMLRQSGSLMDEPRIIHWPGSLRKPWQRIHPRSRSSWDQMWWDAHADMCRQAASPCRISCRLGQPAE